MSEDSLIYRATMNNIGLGFVGFPLGLNFMGLGLQDQFVPAFNWMQLNLLKNINKIKNFKNSS